jgi:hypothetical protein
MRIFFPQIRVLGKFALFASLILAAPTTRAKSLVLASASFGSVDTSAFGVTILPGFRYQEFMMTNFFFEGENLQSRDKTLFRASGGLVMGLFLFSLYGGVGMRNHQSELESTDITIGAGLSLANVYFRTIKYQDDRDAETAWGLKLVFPFYTF